MHQGQGERAAERSGEQSRRAPVRIADGRGAAILSLQRTAGNRAVSDLIKRWRDQGQLYAASRAKAKELESYARATAGELIRRAEDVEPRVTGHIRAVAFSRRGKPKGLEYRIKSQDSLARKLRDKAAENPLGTLAPGKAVQQEADQVSDTLRYTIILEPDATYGHLFAEISETMKKFKYTPDLRKNYWERSTTYKGINLTFKTPDSPPLGFEVQLHTEGSFATKQRNHEEYEEERELDTSEERKKVLNETMEGRWRDVTIPANIRSMVPSVDDLQDNTFVPTRRRR